MEQGENAFRSNSNEEQKVVETAKALNAVVINASMAQNLVPQINESTRDILLSALLGYKKELEEKNRLGNKESYFGQYKEQLENLDKLFDQIRSLRWEKMSGKPSVCPDMKKFFLRYLEGDEKSDKLKIYINKISKIDILDEAFSGEMTNSFMYLFTEIFRLNAYLKLCPYKSGFEKIDFPINELEESLELLRKKLKEIWDLDLIIPNTYTDQYKDNPDLYKIDNGASHILAAHLVNMFEFEKNIENGIITDFQTIGVHSDRLNINKKPVVYLHANR